MEQLIIQVENQAKAKMLSEILSALDFVSSVEVIKKTAVKSEGKEDFFALAGLWENRNITAESVRQEAWLGQAK